MENWEEKSNNEIVIRLKEMEEEHKQIKNKIIDLYDTMEAMEKSFQRGNEVLLTRLKKPMINEQI